MFFVTEGVAAVEKREETKTRWFKALLKAKEAHKPIDSPSFTFGMPVFLPAKRETSNCTSPGWNPAGVTGRHLQKNSRLTFSTSYLRNMTIQI
jgi:hypothetical protein